MLYIDNVDSLDIVDSVDSADTCRRVCVPASRDVLFSDENLFLSLRAPPTECQTNPCGAGSWPWLDQEDGYYRWAGHKLNYFLQ